MKIAKCFVLVCFTLITALGSMVCAEEKKAPAPAERSWKEYFFRRSGKKKVMPEKKAIVHEELNPEGMLDLVDAPTTNVVDYSAFRLNFRLYSKGGLISHLSFGVFQRLNIGASWDNEDVIGSENPKSNAPTLNLKFRAYDGGEALPSFTIGYDGQGRFFNRTTEEYVESERGLFAVCGREILFPKLEAYGGGNIAKFKDGTVLGFVGLSYTIEQRFVLMMEYDNIRVGPQNRWNAGIRIFPIPSLGIDLAIRRIASNQDKDRIIRINYVGSF